MSRKGDRRRLAILRFVADYVGEHGFAPSVLEIGDGVGTPGTGSVTRHLDVLEKQGRIQREPHTQRGMRLLLTPDVKTVPVKRCGTCQQDMPADHSCRAFAADPYSSPSDLYEET